MDINVLELGVELSVTFGYESNTIEGSPLELLLAKYLPSKAFVW